MSSRDVMKVSFEYSPSNDLVVNHSMNPKIIRAFSEKKSRTGTLYRNKNNVIMCRVPPCRTEWAASFISVDETGKSDAFKLTWTETVFEYVSLTGVSKRDLEWCVDAACLNFQDPRPFQPCPEARDRAVCADPDEIESGDQANGQRKVDAGCASALSRPQAAWMSFPRLPPLVLSAHYQSVKIRWNLPGNIVIL